MKIPTLQTALLVLLALSLSACAASETHLIPTDPEGGSPRIVASNVCVSVTALAEASTPAGGRVEQLCIGGHVVMSVAEYRAMLADLDRLSEQVATLQQSNAIRERFARVCREDKVCNGVALRTIQKEGIVK